jgi:serine/threonine-protein kinase SRPK3
MACISLSGLLEMQNKSKVPTVVLRNIYADLVNRAEKYVAAKILRADYNGSHGGEYAIFEREMFSKISDVSRHCAHEGRHYVLPVLDEFTHKGPNGEYVCLVFDVMGYHLGHQVFHFKTKRLPVKGVKSTARQILLGLDFLHIECGIIHTGMTANHQSKNSGLAYGTDVQPSNIIMELEDSKKTRARHLSENAPQIDDDGTPLREVVPTSLLSAVSNPHIGMVDFGVGQSIYSTLRPFGVGEAINHRVLERQTSHQYDSTISPTRPGGYDRRTLG